MSKAKVIAIVGILALTMIFLLEFASRCADTDSPTPIRSRDYFLGIHDTPLVSDYRGYCNLVSVGETEIRFGNEVYTVRKTEIPYEDRQRLSLWLRIP